MTLTSVANGSQLLVIDTPTELFPQVTALNHYTVKIYFDDLVANDKVIVRVLDEDINDSVEKSYRNPTVVGVQTNPLHLINWIPSVGFRITCEQTQGTAKTITWELLSSS